MNADEANKENSSNENLIEREQLEGTPFWLIRQEEKWAIVMGKYKMNDKELRSREEAIKYMEDNKYNISLRMTMIIVNDIIREQEEGKKNDNTTIRMKNKSNNNQKLKI